MCMLVENGNEEYTFPTLPHDGHAAKHVNDLLKEFKYNDFVLTSHSNRHGAAQKADSNQDVNINWIVQRGDWVLDSISTMFEYISGSTKGDRAVARALAGWPVKCDVIPPSIAYVTSTDTREKLKHIADCIFVRFSLKENLKVVLFAVQIMYYNAVLISSGEESGSNLIVLLLRKECLRVGLDEASLQQASTEMHESFHLLNIGSIDTNMLPETLTTELRLVKDMNKDLLTQIHHVNRTVVGYEEKFNDLKNQIASLVIAVSRGVVLPAPIEHGQFIAPAPDVRMDLDDLPVQPVLQSFPLDLYSLANITIKDSLIRFIMDDLATALLPTQKARTAHSAMRRMNSFTRHLLPELYATLPERVEVRVGPLFNNYKLNVSRVCYLLEAQLMIKIREHQDVFNADHVAQRSRRTLNGLSTNIKILVGMLNGQTVDGVKIVTKA